MLSIFLYRMLQRICENKKGGSFSRRERGHQVQKLKDVPCLMKAASQYDLQIAKLIKTKWSSILYHWVSN